MTINFKSLQELSDVTRQLYIDRLKRLLAIFDNNMNVLLCKPYHVYHKLRGLYDNWHTINSYISVIHTIVTRLPLITEQMVPDKIEDWNKISDFCLKQCQLLTIANKNRKNIAYTYQDLVEKLETLDGKDKLLLAMYTLIPPVRSDYNALRIVRNEDEYMEFRDDNLLYMSDDICFIELVKYKTDKVYGRMRGILPDNLVDIIRDNTLDTAVYLFSTPKGGPYSKRTFAQLIRNTLLKQFGDKLSINDLRHIYITGNVNLELDPKSRLEIARRMCHSTDTQIKYLWNDDNKATATTPISTPSEC